MLKTMKIKKKLRLDELIKYVWDNELNPIVCFKDGGGRASVIFGHAGSIGFGEYSYGTFHKNDTFTVEVEEPITEDTIFNTLVDVNNNDEVHIAWNDSISLYDKEQTKEIHAIVNGKLQLIWEAE